MKIDLPKLFGFEHAEVFTYDRNERNLYCMSVRVNDPSQDPEAKKGRGFEEEFIINEK